MSDWLAARRYAQAFFEIARSAHQDAAIEEELVSFSEAFSKSEDLRKFLTHPAIKLQAKVKLIERLYGQKPQAVSKMLVDFFSFLLQKRRFGLIQEIARSFKEIADMAQGEAMIRIQTAVPLSGEQVHRIVSYFEKLTGFRLFVQKVLDLSLVGGLVIQVGNRLWDGSVKGGILRLKRELTHGVEA